MQLPAKQNHSLGTKKKIKKTPIIPGTQRGERHHPQNSTTTAQFPGSNCPGDQKHTEEEEKNPGKMRFYLVERRELQPELHLGHFRAAFGGLSARKAAAGGGCSAQSGERSIHSQGSWGALKANRQQPEQGKWRLRARQSRPVPGDLHRVFSHDVRALTSSKSRADFQEMMPAW